MIQVTLVFSPGPRRVVELTLEVAEGTTLAQAMVMAKVPPLPDASPEEGGHPWAMGIWGRKADAATPLREGDRVELYRPLRVDPKVARRERFVGQGARGAGLFARRRAHSKAGY